MVNVLIIEDDVDIAENLKDVFAFKGLEAAISRDGREALTLLRSTDHLPGVILLDLMMPIMDGPTATREIRHLGGHAAQLPIVALTANAMPGDRESYMAAGMDDYVSKPVDPAKLMEVLRGLMTLKVAARN